MKHHIQVKAIHRVHETHAPAYGYTKASEEGPLRIAALYDPTDFRTFPRWEKDLGVIEGRCGSPLVLDALFNMTEEGAHLLERMMEEVPHSLPVEITVKSHDIQKKGMYRDVERSFSWRFWEQKSRVCELNLQEKQAMFSSWPYTNVLLLKETRKQCGMHVINQNLEVMASERYSQHPSNVLFYSVNNEVLWREDLSLEFNFPSFQPDYLIGKISAQDVELTGTLRNSDFLARMPFEHVIEVKFPLHRGFGERYEFLVAQIQRAY